MLNNVKFKANDDMRYTAEFSITKTLGFRNNGRVELIAAKTLSLGLIRRCEIYHY